MTGHYCGATRYLMRLVRELQETISRLARLGGSALHE